MLNPLATNTALLLLMVQSSSGGCEQSFFSSYTFIHKVSLVPERINKFARKGFAARSSLAPPFIHVVFFSAGRTRSVLYEEYIHNLPHYAKKDFLGACIVVVGCGLLFTRVVVVRSSSICVLSHPRVIRYGVGVKKRRK